MFFVNGAALATWVPLIPAVQQKLALNTGELGIALLGVAVGAVISTPSTGWLVGRAGGRRVVTVAAVVGCAILPILPLAPTLPLLALSLLVFGAALATMDVAMNIQGSVVEASYERPLMSTFHGFYSIGGFAGALTGGALAALGFTPFDRAPTNTATTRTTETTSNRIFESFGIGGEISPEIRAVGHPTKG